MAVPLLLLALMSPLAQLGASALEVEDATEQCAAGEPTGVWPRSRQTLSHFEVAGVNLALWFGGDACRREPAEGARGSEPFELFEDFDIADLIKGNETWWDLVAYRRMLQRPSLSFYVDKVARKRWLPAKGFAQPRPLVLNYAHELTDSGDEEDERLEIMGLLPEEADYAAKPTHMSMTKGVWLVKHDAESGATRFSKTGMELTDDWDFEVADLVDSLSKQLHKTADHEGEYAESWALRNVRPGLVIEELFAAVDYENVPPMELSLFVVWGRLWLANANEVRGFNRWSNGFYHRNGSAVPGNPHGDIPEWVDWPLVLSVAERLGANKDMFRVDMFVGLPAKHPLLQEGSTEEERKAAAHYVVSESEIHPTTIFWDSEVCNEGARLWIAGYKTGNYRLVPNTEVPPAFLETGICAPSACDA